MRTYLFATVHRRIWSQPIVRWMEYSICERLGSPWRGRPTPPKISPSPSPGNTVNVTLLNDEELLEYLMPTSKQKNKVSLRWNTHSPNNSVNVCVCIYGDILWEHGDTPRKITTWKITSISLKLACKEEIHLEYWAIFQTTLSCRCIGCNIIKVYIVHTRIGDAGRNLSIKSD